jgi:hypothetical protein
MKKILFLSFTIMLAACSTPKLEKQLAETQEALTHAEALIEEMQESQVNKIVHTLYFTLKPDLPRSEREQFVGYLKQLGELPYVSEIKVGIPDNMPDPRAKKDYDYAMELQFANQDELAAYQQDSTHIAIRTLLGPQLGGPPLVYDFEVIE